MRLDKFLKVSRVIKRRTVAKEVCTGGRVQVNGRVAKAGTELEVGDFLVIELGRRILEIRVLALADSVRAEDAQSLYEVLRVTEKPRDDFFGQENG